MAVLIRDAGPADIAAITAIYAVEVTDFVNTYEYDIPDDEKWAVVPRVAFGFVEDDTFATSATKWRFEL